MKEEMLSSFSLYYFLGNLQSLSPDMNYKYKLKSNVNVTKGNLHGVTFTQPACKRYF